MLLALPDHIVETYESLYISGPRNPTLGAWFTMKMDMLRSPSIVADVIQGRRWVEGTARTVYGDVPIAGLFPLESMRAEVAAAVQHLERYVPLLADYLATPFPTGRLQVWYGFQVGMSARAGHMYMEDRTTYDGRRSDTQIHYNTGLTHELSHSYVGNESLTQFLELYLYNVDIGLGVDPQAWSDRRGWGPVGGMESGVGYALDVAHRVGPDVMRRGMRAIVPFRPPFQQPLSVQVLTAFMAQVPVVHQAYVEERLRRIQF